MHKNDKNAKDARFRMVLHPINIAYKFKRKYKLTFQAYSKGGKYPRHAIKLYLDGFGIEKCVFVEDFWRSSAG